jgi:hypothetical protein
MKDATAEFARRIPGYAYLCWSRNQSVAPRTNAVTVSIRSRYARMLECAPNDTWLTEQNKRTDRLNPGAFPKHAVPLWPCDWEYGYG